MGQDPGYEPIYTMHADRAAWLITSNLFLPKQSRLALKLAAMFLYCNTYRELHEDSHFAALSHQQVQLLLHVDVLQLHLCITNKIIQLWSYSYKSFCIMFSDLLDIACVTVLHSLQGEFYVATITWLLSCDTCYSLQTNFCVLGQGNHACSDKFHVGKRLQIRNSRHHSSVKHD